MDNKSGSSNTGNSGNIIGGQPSTNICPSCGYCSCCGRPRNSFNYPQYIYPYPSWHTHPYAPPITVTC